MNYSELVSMAQEIKSVAREYLEDANQLTAKQVTMLNRIVSGGLSSPEIVSAWEASGLNY